MLKAAFESTLTSGLVYHATLVKLQRIRLPGDPCP